MTKRLLNQFVDFIEKSKVKFHKSLLIFLFFVFVATIFWFLSALNLSYTTLINYPVKYTNPPEGVVLVNPPPENLSLKVTGHGYTLLRHKISKEIIPIIFDLNAFVLQTLGDKSKQQFYVLTRAAHTKIANQLSREIEVLEISPDTIFFIFSDAYKKKLPVKPVLNLEFEKQFMIKGDVKVYPDSVYVEGPKSLVDTMKYAYTNEITLNNIRDSVSHYLTIKDVNQVTYSHSRVSLNFQVEQFTEASLKIPITQINVPEQYSLKLFPDEITAYYLVALSDYENIKTRHFMAIADFHLLGNDAPPAKLKIKMSRIPEQIILIRYFPESVDYIIEK